MRILQIKLGSSNHQRCVTKGKPVGVMPALREHRPTAVRLLVAAFLCLCLGACATTRSSSPGVPPELKHSWEVSFNRGDASGVAALYAPDAQLVMPDAPPTRGAAQIERTVNDMIKSGVKVKIDAEHNVRAGDIAYVYGTYVVRTGEEGPEVERGVYLEIWRLRNAEWKIDLDVNTTVARVLQSGR